jgi:hypothetical protein
MKIYVLGWSHISVMAADEYFDSVGNVLSYILSAEDFIVRQQGSQEGVYFIINRNGTNLELYAPPDKRYFTIFYSFSITDQLKAVYEEDSQQLSRHMDEYGIEDSAVRDENLYDIVAFNRCNDIDIKEAENVISRLSGTYIHTDCRFRTKSVTDPQNREESEEVWDGFEVVGLLYPYEDSFDPRDYEQTAQEIISVGGMVQKEMKKLDVMNEIDFEGILNINN